MTDLKQHLKIYFGLWLHKTKLMLKKIRADKNADTRYNLFSILWSSVSEIKEIV